MNRIIFFTSLSRNCLIQTKGPIQSLSKDTSEDIVDFPSGEVLNSENFLWMLFWEPTLRNNQFLDGIQLDIFIWKEAL